MALYNQKHKVHNVHIMDTLPVVSQGTWEAATSVLSLVELQVTALLVNLAGVTHVVDAASAGYTKSVLISIFQQLLML